jgi:hypothetical protein
MMDIEFRLYAIEQERRDELRRLHLEKAARAATRRGAASGRARGMRVELPLGAIAEPETKVRPA